MWNTTFNKNQSSAAAAARRTALSSAATPSSAKRASAFTPADTANRASAVTQADTATPSANRTSTVTPANTGVKVRRMASTPATASALAAQVWQNELKCLSAMVALDLIWQTLKPMKKNQLFDTVAQYCHGLKHKGIVAMFSLLLKGDGVFEKLWVKQIDTAGEVELIVSPLISPNLRLVSGTSFTNASIRNKSLKGGAVTTGRALHVMAQEGIANCKKALSFVKQFLDKNGNLPSGTSEADLYDFVLEGMYKLEQANKQKKKASSAVAIDLDGSDDDASVASTVVSATTDPEETQLPDLDETQLPGDEEGSVIEGTFELVDNDLHDEFLYEEAEETVKRPVTWFFKGFAALVLFGPMSEHNSSSVIFGCTDVEKGKGRAALRVQEAAAAAVERDNTIGRGVPLGGNMKDAALMGISDEDLQHRSADRELFAIKEQISCIQKRFDNTVMLINAPWYPEERKESLKTDIPVILELLDEKQKELNLLGKRKRTVAPAVTSFISAVGGVISIDCDENV